MKVFLAATVLLTLAFVACVGDTDEEGLTIVLSSPSPAPAVSTSTPEPTQVTEDLGACPPYIEGLGILYEDANICASRLPISGIIGVKVLAESTTAYRERLEQTRAVLAQVVTAEELCSKVVLSAPGEIRDQLLPEDFKLPGCVLGK